MMPDRALLFRLIFPTDCSDRTVITESIDPAEFLTAEMRGLFATLIDGVDNRGELNLTAIRAQLSTRAPSVMKLYDDLATTSLDEDDGGPVAPLIRAFHEWVTAERVKGLVTTAATAIKTGESVADVRRRLEDGLSNLADHTLVRRKYDDINAQAEDVLSFLTEEKPRGLTFGFSALDRVIVPLVPGNLLILGGATGTGKSTVARNFIRNWHGMNKRVGLFSLEMSATEQLMNLGCMDTAIAAGRAITRDILPDERQRIWRAVSAWRDSGLRLNDKANVTPEYLLRAMKRYRADGIDVFVVDHLHRLDFGTTAERELRLRMGAVARALKAFAMDEQCIVVALAQLVKKSRSDEPSDADIRETATIAEEADKILFVYRPDVACNRRADGVLVPIARDGRGRRHFGHDAPTGSVMGPDDERVYIKPGKQRVQPQSALISIAINAETGLMQDAPCVSIGGRCA
jgi:replicative DNA helicase